MPRTVQFLGAPTALGLKPYDDGTPRRVHEGPAVMRRLGLVERIGARDLGDVAAGAYVDHERPAGGVRNVEAVAEHARRLAEVVAREASPATPLLVMGGDCSICLGALLGLRRRGRHGLVYLDGHCDFATPVISQTGAVGGMDLALAVARYEHPLARLAPDGPLVREEDVALLGRKDLYDEPAYGPHSVRHTGILDLPLDAVRERGLDAAADAALARVARPELDGFWVHMDVDVLLPEVMPAVDSPEPDGLSPDEAARLLGRLLASPRAVGLQVTIYDPGLDPDGESGRRLAGLLAAAARAMGGRGDGA